MTFVEWCAYFETLTVEDMSDLTATAFTTMLNAEQYNIYDPEIVKELEQEPAYQMVGYHCNRVGLDANLYAKSFLFALCQNPAQITMYVCYLRSKSPTLTMRSLTTLFPLGFVKQDDLRKAWDAQKLEGAGFSGAQLDSFSYLEASL